MLNLADLEARLESRNYVSMRYGWVTGTKEGEAQIQLNDAKNNVSICRSALSMSTMPLGLRMMRDKRKLIALG